MANRSAEPASAAHGAHHRLRHVVHVPTRFRTGHRECLNDLSLPARLSMSVNPVIFVR